MSNNRMSNARMNDSRMNTGDSRCAIEVDGG
jgi:hypothetical protein